MRTVGGGCHGFSRHLERLAREEFSGGALTTDEGFDEALHLTGDEGGEAWAALVQAYRDTIFQTAPRIAEAERLEGKARSMRKAAEEAGETTIAPPSFLAPEPEPEPAPLHKRKHEPGPLPKRKRMAVLESEEEFSEPEAEPERTESPKPVHRRKFKRIAKTETESEGEGESEPQDKEPSSPVHQTKTKTKTKFPPRRLKGLQGSQDALESEKRHFSIEYDDPETGNIETGYVEMLSSNKDHVVARWLYNCHQLEEVGVEIPKEMQDAMDTLSVLHIDPKKLLIVTDHIQKLPRKQLTFIPLENIWEPTVQMLPPPTKWEFAILGDYFMDTEETRVRKPLCRQMVIMLERLMQRGMEDPKRTKLWMQRMTRWRMDPDNMQDPPVLDDIPEGQRHYGQCEVCNSKRFLSQQLSNIEHENPDCALLMGNVCGAYVRAALDLVISEGSEESMKTAVTVNATGMLPSSSDSE